jgi:hypothetical protein
VARVLTAQEANGSSRTSRSSHFGMRFKFKYYKRLSSSTPTQTEGSLLFLSGNKLSGSLRDIVVLKMEINGEEEESPSNSP